MEGEVKIYIDEAVMITDLTFSGAEEIGVDADADTGLAVLPESVPVLVLMRQKRFKDQGMRYYYAAHPPLLAVVVTWDLPLEAYRGQVVDASVGWDEGWPRYVHRGNEGKQHTKVTIRGALEARPEEADATLSEILWRAPRSREEGAL